MVDLEELPEVSLKSLDDVFYDEPQPDEQYEMGKLEAKLEGMRTRLCEKFPLVDNWIGGNYDIKIGIAQGIGTLIPTIAVNVAFALTPAATLSYLGIMAARYISSVFTIAAAYAGVHYFMNDRYKGRVKEMFTDAFKFTAIDRGIFLPTRGLVFCLESVLVGSLGLSRYIVGNLVPLLTAFQAFGTNYAGRNIKEGYTMGDALKQGFKELGGMVWNLVKSSYTLSKKAYGAIFHREPPLPYPLDEPEEYIADWHASMKSDSFLS